MRRIIPHVSEENLGGPIAQVGGALEQVARGEAARYSMDAVSRSQETWLQNLKTAQEQAPAGAPGFTNQVMGDYQKYVQDTLKNAPSTLARRMMQPHLSQLGVHLFTQSTAFEAQSRHEHALITGQESNERAANMVLQQPGMYDSMLAQQVSGINSLNIDPGDKEKLAVHAKAVMSHAAVTGDINADPYQALVNLTAKEQKGYYGDLTVEQRGELFGHADMMLHQRIADAERVERLQDKQEHKEAAATLAQAVTLAHNPNGSQLTADWIRRRAGLFADNPHGLEFMYNLMSGDDAAPHQTLPKLYADLRARQAQGVDIGDELTQLYANGKVAHQDFNFLMTQNEKDHPNWYKQGVGYIKRELNKGMFELNPGAVEADALREFDHYRSEQDRLQHPVSNQDGIDEATSVVNFYKARGDQGAPPGGHIAPRFLVGSLDNPDINATQEATRQAIKQGIIPPEEAGQEALRVQQLVRMAQQRAQIKARADEKKNAANK